MDMMNFTVGFALAQRYKRVSGADRMRAAAAAGFIPPPAAGIVTAKVVLDRANPPPDISASVPAVTNADQHRKIAALESSVSSLRSQLDSLSKQVSELLVLIQAQNKASK